MTSDPTELINKLAADLKPVKRLWAPGFRFLVWFSISALIVGLEIVLTGDFRPGAFDQLWESPRFLLETTLAFLVPIFSALAAFYLSVPGGEYKRWPLILSLAMFFGFVALLVLGLVYPALPSTTDGNRSFCIVKIPLYGLIPLAILFMMIKQGAPFKWKVLCFLIALSSFLPVVAAMQLACMYDPAHNLIGHVLPVFLMTLVVLFLGKIFLRES